MPTTPLTRIALVGTGGTIAATASTHTKLTDYDITEGLDSLLAAVPQVRRLARFEPHQVFNTDSRAMTSAMLLKLAQTVNALLQRDDIDAVLMTHGTDTLEESAFFLHLCIKSHKPVVMTAAMRPASAYSADGALNLYHAVLTACSPGSAGQGVLVVMNDQIHSARFLSKQHTSRPDAFASPDAGPLGQIAAGHLRYLLQTVLPHTVDSPFDIQSLQELPSVLILFDHPDACPDMFRSAAQSGAQGLVVAATGNGSLTPGSIHGLQIAQSMGVACVRASRISAGAVTPSQYDEQLHLIAAQFLPAIKARILLMLGLTLTRDIQTLRQIFSRY